MKISGFSRDYFVLKNTNKSRSKSPNQSILIQRLRSKCARLKALMWPRRWSRRKGQSGSWIGCAWSRVYARIFLAQTTSFNGAYKRPFFNFFLIFFSFIFFLLSLNFAENRSAVSDAVAAVLRWPLAKQKAPVDGFEAPLFRSVVLLGRKSI